MADPFDVANGDPAADAAAAQGGDSFGPSFYRNLMNFGASTMVAANARTPQGFLQYGGGIAGPVGAGVLGAMEASRQNAGLASQIGLRSAETQNAQQDVISKRIQTAMARGNYNFAAPFYGTPQLDQNGNPIPGTGGGGMLGGMGGQPQGQPQSGDQSQGAGGAAATAGGASGDVASRVRGIEGGYGTQQNAGGYLGAYQFGSAALMDAGIYKPAPGEDPTKNTWQGTINVAPWAPMTPQQFAQNPQAQDVAFQITAKRNLGLAQQNGLTQYLGQTVGGVPITQDSLIGMMHFGGVAGTAHFLQSGGQYNPNDNPNDPAHGTTLAQYGQRVAGVSQRIAQQGQGQPGQGGPMPQQGAPGQQLDGMSIARQIMMGQLPNPSPEQARAAAPMIARLPLPNAAEISKKLFDFGYAGPQAGSVKAAEGETQTPVGFQRTPNGLVPIPGGPGDPNYLTQKNQAAMTSLRGPGSAVYQNGHIVAQVPMPVTRIDPKGNEFTEYVNPMLEGGQPGAVAPGAPPGSVLSVQKTLGPMQHEFLEERGKGLGEQFQDIDTHASAAIEGNYLLDNMRRESQSWQMGKFADWEGAARGYAQAFATSLGIKAPALDDKLADFQAFVKSTGQITRAAVHETSSRAAAQEYQMIQSTLPSPTMTSQAFGRIADQMQGVYDYSLAKQKFAHAYTGDPNEMNVQFNQKLTPGAFMLNRMAQTPQGQSDLQAMMGKMAQTPEGRAKAAQLQAEVGFAKQNGYFDQLKYDTPSAQTAAPPGGPVPTTNGY